MKFLEEKKIILDKWYLIPILILGIHFIYRLINQSQMLFIFPLDITNDLSSLLAQLFFLAKCGFHNICPYWYNGYEVLKYYAPGWFYFALPLYFLTRNVQFAAYISLVLMYILSFIFLLLLSKTQRISLIKTILFFFLFFANPITIGNFIRLGRYFVIFSFMIFILLMTIILWYKNHKINKKFYLLFIPVYAIILLSHQQEAILFSFLILSLFLIKPLKQKLHIITAGIIGVCLVLFWWIPFIKSTLANTTMLDYAEGKWLLEFTGQWFLTNIASFIVPIILIFVFCMYWMYNKHKNSRELIFYSPILILSILFFTRIIVFIPILNQISPDVFMTFFLFIAIFLFVKIKYWPFKIKDLVIPTIIMLSLISVSVSIIHTPLFSKYTETEINTLGVLKNVEGKFLILNAPPPTSYDRAYYSYAPIYHNLSTPDGWAQQTLSKKYDNLLSNTTNSLKNRDCTTLTKALDFLNTTSVITYGQDCSTLDYCNLKYKESKGEVCLYITKF